MIGVLRSFSVRNYRVYALGAIVSNVGTWMQRVAQDWLVLSLTGNGAMLGLTTGLQLLPALLFSPLAGAVADRWPRRRTLQVTQLAMAVPSAILGVLAVTESVQTWHVLVLAFAFGVATTFDAPARHTFPSDLVEESDIANAVALNGVSMHSARLIGPAIAGLLIAAGGGGVRATGLVILVNTASYLVVLASLALIDAARLGASPRPRPARAIRAGFRYVLSRKDLSFLMACALALGLFGYPLQLLSALMVTDVYGLGASEYGFVSTATAVGSLVGGIAIAWTRRPRLRVIAASGVAFGLVEMVVSLMPGYSLFIVCFPLLGLTSLTMVTAANVSIQLMSAPEMRGRVSASFFMVLMGGAAVGAPALGWLAETTSPRVAILTSGAAFCGVLLCASLLLRPRGGQIGSAARPRPARAAVR